MRITETSAATAFGNAMDLLPAASAQVSEPEQALVVANAMSAVGDAVTSFAQSDLVDSLTALVDNLGFVVKLGDEISKVHKHRSSRLTALISLQIHPWASLAWNVLSIGLKVGWLAFDRSTVSYLCDSL